MIAALKKIKRLLSQLTDISGCGSLNVMIGD